MTGFRLCIIVLVHIIKHCVLRQCWFIVDISSATMAQHYANIGSMYGIWWDGDGDIDGSLGLFSCVDQHILTPRATP